MSLVGQDAYKNVIRELTTDDDAAPETFNPVFLDLLNNDVHLNNKISTISTTISSGAIQTPTIVMGSNKITIPEIPVAPKIDLTGMSYTNLLGKDGNCEDVSKWNSNVCTSALDDLDKVFDGNSIKCTSTTSGLFGVYKMKSAVPAIDYSKHYMFSAYVKGTAPTARLKVGEASIGAQTAISSLTWTRLCLKFTPAQISIASDFDIYGDASAIGNTLSVDGIMLNEISAADYALTDAQHMAKYPYVDSYGVLTNPYFENRRYNLVRNGNCEKGVGCWNATDTFQTLSIIESKFKLVTTVAGSGNYEKMVLKPNTNYYLTGTISGVTALFVQGVNNTEKTIIRNGSGVFNSGMYDYYFVGFYNPTIGTGTADSIMLTEGTISPTSYQSCDLQRFVVEGQFTQDDKIVIENGEINGYRQWKHPSPLYGKNYDWIFGEDNTGFKLVLFNKIGLGIPDWATHTLVKYDGKIIEPYSGGWSKADLSIINTVGLHITISDVDSGWAEGINPNADEGKAFMNGWKAVWYADGRYAYWCSVIDFKPAPIHISSSLVSGTGTSFTVTDASKFVVGDTIAMYHGTTGIVFNESPVTAISGNVITISFSTTTVTTATDYVIKKDVTNALNYCKSNVAPNYEGYRLHYKLANPEPITDTNVHVHGEIWDLVKGDNYVYVDSGIVLGEVANPRTYLEFTRINSPTIDFAGSRLKNKAEIIKSVYKNLIYDPLWGTYQDPLGYSIVGLGQASIQTTNFDPNATYTVDYQILKTLHAQSFGSLAMSYMQSILATLDNHSKELEQKQSRNSVLDTLIDESMYEEGKVYIMNRGVRHWSNMMNSTLVQIRIPYSKKLVVPRISINNLLIYTSSATGTWDVTPLLQSDCDVEFGVPTPAKTYFVLTTVIKAGTKADNALNYGVRVGFDWKADCKGRV